VKYGGASTVNLEAFGKGEGPTINTMRTLGLLGRKPTVAFRSDAMTSILPAGKDLGVCAVKRAAQADANANAKDEKVTITVNGDDKDVKEEDVTVVVGNGHA